MALNPRKKRKGNRSARRGKRRSASVRRSSNPTYRTKRRWSTKRRRNVVKVYNRKRRRNPAVFGNLQGLLVRSAWAIGGGIATRSGPEMLLGERNTGFFGYAANGITAIVGGALIGKVTKSPVAAESWTLGGLVMLTSRIIDDVFKKKLVSFAPVSELVPQLSGDPAYRLAGDYIDQSFPVPYSSLASGRPAPLALPPPEVAAAAINAGLSGDPTWDTPWN